MPTSGTPCATWVHSSISDPSPAERNAPAPGRTRNASQSSYARKIWDQARPIAGTLAETYLRRRGITASLSGCLRFHPDCLHGPSGARARFPAMIARVDGGEAFAIHRTYLRPGGEAKADLDPAKMALGPCRGGAVRLVEIPNAPLVVAEGIETALSLASGLFPYPCLRLGGPIGRQHGSDGPARRPRTPDRRHGR